MGLGELPLGQPVEHGAGGGGEWNLAVVILAPELHARRATVVVRAQADSGIARPATGEGEALDQVTHRPCSGVQQRAALFPL